MRELFDPLGEASLTSHARYERLADGDVVDLAQRGRQDAAEHLLYKYRNLVRSKVKSYFLVGAEREDLLQVGMIGLWQAIVDYRHDKATSFPAFAKVCIHRHIITAIKAATPPTKKYQMMYQVHAGFLPMTIPPPCRHARGMPPGRPRP